MTLFDLAFLLAALTSLVTLLVVASLAALGHGARGLRILRAWGLGAAAYLLAGIGAALARPQHVLQVGEPWCFDDWCLTVGAIHRAPAPAYTTYRLSLVLSSRARRVSQRAAGAWVCLIDDRGRRYYPEPDPAAAPLDVLLRPGESIATSRVFRVPGDARGLGLVTGHGGRYCGPMSFLVIGDSGCLFNKPTMIRIGSGAHPQG